MRAIYVIHFKIRPTLHIPPPVFSDRREKCADSLGDTPVDDVHILLRFRLILLCPSLIDDGFASCLSDQRVQLHGSLKETFLGAKGMRMFLQDDIVIVAIEDVESDIQDRE
ncbi:MAG: hypothetical protein IKE76_16830 [Clostridia bacterium]|nr:hypothetical protein [Clostridia bacterium]